MEPGKLVEKLVQQHFPKFGTLRKKCIYTQTGNAIENVDTGVVLLNIVSVHPNLYIIFDLPSNSLINKQAKDDNPVISIDKIAIFPVLDLSIVPSQKDIITDHNSVEWEVLSLFSDPQPSHYELLIRPM